VAKGEKVLFHPQCMMSYNRHMLPQHGAADRDEHTVLRVIGSLLLPTPDIQSQRVKDNLWSCTKITEIPAPQSRNES